MEIDLITKRFGWSMNHRHEEKEWNLFSPGKTKEITWEGQDDDEKGTNRCPFSDINLPRPPLFHPPPFCWFYRHRSMIAEVKVIWMRSIHSWLRRITICQHFTIYPVKNMSTPGTETQEKQDQGMADDRVPYDPSTSPNVSKVTVTSETR